MKIEPHIIIYTTSRFECPYCERAKKLLSTWQYSYEELDIVDISVKNKLKDILPDVKTVPQIFVENIHIGGYDDLYKLGKNGFDSLWSLSINAT